MVPARALQAAWEGELAKHGPVASVATRPAIELMMRQAELIDGPEPTNATPASELPSGVPAPCRLDLR